MQHPTTRPGVILALSLVIILLIPVWGALGFFAPVEEKPAQAQLEDEPPHSVKAFIAEAQAFLVKNTREDGCVEPREKDAQGRIVVYFRALQYGYLPPKLCLKAGQTYVFKMMATDVTHGASIQLGTGSRMVRLPAGVEVEQEYTFTEPGEYLVYCSYYCGVGHPFMKGKIIVQGS